MLVGSMMLAATGPGPNARLFSPVELGVWRDIGYGDVLQIGAVPEPSSFLAITLLVGIGASRRGRRSVQVAA